MIPGALPNILGTGDKEVRAAGPGENVERTENLEGFPDPGSIAGKGPPPHPDRKKSESRVRPAPQEKTDRLTAIGTRDF